MFGRRKTVSTCGAQKSTAGSKLRSKSVPLINAKSKSRGVKGIMKYVTDDDSMHAKYGKGGASTDEIKEAGEATSDETNSDSNDCRRVVLKDICIREYARTIGDNPSCSSGPPISIAWDYDPETKIITVDEYEGSRPPRRTNFEMVLPRDIRQSMLKKEWDVTQGQIAAAVRANIKIKNQRRSTVNNLGKADKIEEMMESAGKKVFRGLLMKKSSDREAEELLERRAKQARQQTKRNAHIAAPNPNDYDGDTDQNS